jgi:hypothetical protein
MLEEIDPRRAEIEGQTVAGVGKIAKENGNHSCAQQTYPRRFPGSISFLKCEEKAGPRHRLPSRRGKSSRGPAVY